MHNQTMGRGALSEAGDVSAREAEVLAAIAEHLTNAEIAGKLFISVRTVESHVSSLLRKFQVADRRALVTVAARLQSVSNEPDTVAAALPAPLTSFVGRVTERAALAEALAAHRLVTAVGPGGVGKTRLALRVAADVGDRFADGVWFVDLVPVTDAAMIASTIASALGLGEYQGRSAEDTVLSWLADREALLVLDNCEHLLDGLVALVERSLAGSPRLVVLATSRARLLVPFERVFPVPGLSIKSDDGGPGDAVELFLDRAAATGSPLRYDDWQRVAVVCRGLDGMALAVELAAARVPSLGLDGLEAGLVDQLHLLTGGRRIDDRHRSLRSAIHWSYALLDERERTVLRRISVFAAPFTADAASVLAGWPPVAPATVPTILAGLADQSLLVAAAEPHGTRYRALETIRQYGSDRLEEAGESVEGYVRHVAWCLSAADASAAPAEHDTGAWRSAFDEVADELRAAQRWASGHAGHRAEAYRLATRLAELCFDRGLSGESQRRYEQAAELALDDRATASALRNAAGAAESRHFGNDALRLHRAAADAALRAGDRSAAAWDLAVAAELIVRRSGMIPTPAPAGELDALLTAARALAAGHPAAEARVYATEAFVGADTDPVTAELTERAVELARRAGDPLTGSAALDQLMSIQIAGGELRAASATAQRRLELLSPLPVTAVSALELADAFYMAAECAVAAGNLRAARRYAERIAELPFHREEGHLATARLIVVAVLAGDWDEAVGLAERFREGWERAGRPRAGNLSRGAYAAATVYGLRGDDDARADWLKIVDGLATPGRPMSAIHVDEFFDGVLLLHRGLPDEAMRRLHPPPEDFRDWYNGMWRPWYAAVWAEAAVAAGHEDAAARIHRARLLTLDNPIAAAMVERAAALQVPAGGRDRLTRAAAALDAAECRYQWARTLVLIGGEQRTRGEAALAAMGARPMAVSTAPAD
jgi:predicted ATPase/DNA-binding CsgD family transcriptional regulator